MAVAAQHTKGFTEALLADGPAGDRSEAMQLYGWLIGDWKLKAVYHGEDGQRLESTGEAHFTWALGGRAIQDVWMVPSRDTPPSDPPFSAAFHGTTLRVYDPKQDAWHVVWTDPVKQMYRHMIARREGRDIVQHETDEQGIRHRWSFTDIEPDSFRWTAERSSGAGEHWHLEVEFFVRRV